MKYELRINISIEALDAQGQHYPGDRLTITEGKILDINELIEVCSVITRFHALCAEIGNEHPKIRRT